MTSAADDEFEAFVAVISDSLGIDFTGCTLASRLVEDLSFDSLAYFEMLAMLEEAANREIDDGAIESIKTMADLYGWWQQFNPIPGTGSSLESSK